MLFAAAETGSDLLFNPLGLTMFHAEGQKLLNSLPQISQDLPVAPELFQQIFSATEEQSAVSMETLAQTMEQDQGLTVNILRMANSVYYGLQSQVSSMRRAVVVLGLKEVRKLLLLLSIRGLEKCLQPGTFDIHAYWKHQVEVAHVVRALAEQCGPVDHDELFTAGLLHDLGKLITAILQPVHWGAIQSLARRKNLPLHLAEDLYWGLDHALIGALTLKTWFLPVSLTETINWHHNPGLALDCGQQAALLQMADALTHVLGESSETHAYSGWEQTLERLGLAFEFPLISAREILQSDAPSAYLHGLGISKAAAH